MILPSAFSPPRWLANRHLQTILPNSPLRRTQALELRSECLELADGDFLRLEWLDRESGPVIVIFHGLEGSSRSPYIRGVMRALHARGFRVVLMSFRGCGGVPNRLARSYHAGETRDLAHVLDTIAGRGPGPIAALGYSLGGNALLKYLGERGTDTPVATAVAVSVPFDLQEACAAMSLGMSRFYRRILLGRLKRSTRSKFAAMPPPFDLAVGLAACDFEGFDGHITAPLHGFADAPDYYRKASCRPWLVRVAVPTLILQAEDDPFMTRAALPRAEDLSDRITLELSERGGHVGFVAGSAPRNLHCWLEGRIVQHFSALLGAQMPSWSPDSACSGECVPDDPPPAPSP